ncbi:MAG: T9SS type A sorting domain-containing protein [Prevotella sp.]|nr:T9SS type A sorting domain-containing protein [Prevotella sp.]MCM1075397.1 T9SS type A sorting domain-containing protein [Ruminococcus sp.]
MRKQLLISSVAMLAAFVATAADSYTPLPGGKVTAVSPNGAYVVGYQNGYENAVYNSFLYTVNSADYVWKTSYTEADLDKSGKFLAVNNAGMIVGGFRDKDKTIQYQQGEFAPGMKKAESEGDIIEIPITSAALWKADGTLVNLGTGTFTTTEFSDGADGAYADGISENGSTIVGYIQIGYQPSYPCKWTLNSATGEYEYSMLQLADGAFGGWAKGVSLDGNVIFGTLVKNGNQYPAIWNAAGNGMTLSISTETLVGASADAVSANGKYVLVTGYNYANTHIAGVYEVATGDIKTVELPAGWGMPVGMTVSDKGDMIVKLTNTTTWTTAMYYCSITQGTAVELDKYLEAQELDIPGLPSFANLSDICGSSDFSVLAGNPAYGDALVLTMTPQQVTVLPAPRVKDFFFASPGSLTFKWYALDNVPEEVTVTGYTAKIGSQSVTLTPDKAVNGVFTATVDVTPGTYNAEVRATGTTAKGAIESSASEMLTAALSETTSWPLFDNWDNVSLDPQGNLINNNDWWHSYLPEGSTSEVIQWNLESYNFENNTPYYCTTAIATVPWSSVLLSRFVDTKAHSNMFISYYMTCQLVNEAEREQLKGDFLDIQISTDGENWTTVDSHCAADLQFGAWNFYKMPVPAEFNGKTFQVRVNARGAGGGSLKWSVDDMSLNDEMTAPTPKGVMATAVEANKVDLTWQNSINAWEVSYVVNSNILSDYCTGSEGAPLITAVDLKPEMTDPFAGKYITSISCFLFDNPAIITNQPTQAEAIVYTDGAEVSRCKYGRDFKNPFPTAIALDKPVQIEAGKKYRIAVRIFDYDVEQTPVYYQTSNEFIAGVTDLYSEDEGKTWLKLSDVYSVAQGNPMGMCIWPLRANITDTEANESFTLDDTLIAYNVLRNGEVINNRPVYGAYLKYTDTDAPADSKYSVQAFYRDGRVSPVSAEFTSSAQRIEADRMFINYEGGVISAANAQSIEIYAINGICVARTGGEAINASTLPDGIYMIRVNADGKTKSRKIAIRK